jgi:hypothetical protein
MGCTYVGWEQGSSVTLSWDKVAWLLHMYSNLEGGMRILGSKTLADFKGTGSAFMSSGRVFWHRFCKAAPRWALHSPFLPPPLGTLLMPFY